MAIVIITIIVWLDYPHQNLLTLAIYVYTAIYFVYICFTYLFVDLFEYVSSYYHCDVF